LAVPVDDDLPTRLREAADTNTIVAVVVDPRSAPDPNVVSLLSKAAETAPNNCAVIIAGRLVGEVSTDNSGPPTFGEEFAAVATRLRHFAGLARAADEFLRSLRAALGEIRGRFTQGATVFRPVQGPENRVIPTVSGPGRGAPR